MNPVAVGRRARAYLARPDVAERRLRFGWRRVRYELERRLTPKRLERDRLVRFGEELRIWVRLGDVVDQSVYLYGAHEYVAARVLATLAPPAGVVADVGGHHGAFTLLAAEKVGPLGRVLAFEPNPAPRHRLVRNVAVNDLRHVTVYAEALSDRVERARLFLSGDSSRSGNASLVLRDGVDGSAGTVEVEAALLDDVVEEAGIDRLDVMKIDVEGSEHRVIEGGRGALDAFRPAVIFEVNGLTRTAAGFSAPAIESLRRLGYRLFGMRLDGAGEARLHELAGGEDPRPHREPWSALNLLALHPGSDAFVRAQDRAVLTPSG